MTTRVTGGQLRLIQEGLEGFLHSLSEKRWTTGQESCNHVEFLSFKLQLHNVMMHAKIVLWSTVCIFLRVTDRHQRLCLCKGIFPPSDLVDQ